MSRSKAECVDYVPKTCVFEATEDPFEFSFQASAKCAKVYDSKNNDSFEIEAPDRIREGSKC